MIRNKKAAQIFSLFAASTILVWAVYFFGFFDTTEEKIIDRFFLKEDPGDEIVIVAIDNESINRIGQWPFERKVFGDVLIHLDTASVVGFDISFFEPSTKNNQDDEVFSRSLKEAAPKIVFAQELEEDVGIVTQPLPIFLETVFLGFVNVTLDGDGFARKLINKKDDAKSFAAAIVEDTLTVPKEMRIDFVGPSETFLTIPFVDVVSGRVPERIFQDRTVLVGATAANLHDFIQTPFGVMAGVELQANAVRTLKEQRFYVDSPITLGALYIMLISFLVALVVYHIQHFVRLLLSLTLLFVFVVGLSMVLFESYFVLPILYALLAFLTSSTSTITYSYVTESKEKRFIRKTFSYYVSPEIVEELVKDPSKLKLGGERRKVTIMFSDLRDFTSISETLSPEELTLHLNEYYTEMTEEIMSRRGVVDKYIGDSTMSYWGAPLDNPDQAYDASMTVLGMIKGLRDLNAKWEKQGKHLFRAGFGVNTGFVVVGNIGSRQRFDYSIIGDEVNFSARLEGLTKNYGVRCLVSESTKEELADHPDIRLRELDLVLVKGKKEPKLIFEMLTVNVDESLEGILKHFGEGRKWYMEGKWEKAIVEFKKALAFGEDGPSKTFLERSLELKVNPPKTWNGVYEFTTK